MPSTLTPESLNKGLRALARRDPDLRLIFKRLGAPPMWSREPGFPTLVHIMLEQQVSLASAKVCYDRLAAAAPVTPRTFLKFSDDALLKIGFSRQKTSYVRSLAKAIVVGELDLEALALMQDNDARAELTKFKGIGPWTADIYLLMALGRPDIWPRGDLALAVAYREVKSLSSSPTQDELEAAGEVWRPWRAVAARLLWSHYLDRRARNGRSNLSENKNKQ